MDRPLPASRHRNPVLCASGHLEFPLRRTGGRYNHGNRYLPSLVLAGANKGATIESFFEHGDVDNFEDFEDEAVICTGDDISLYHADNGESEEGPDENQELEHKEDTNVAGKTIKDVVDSMTEEQRNVLYALVAEAAGAADDKDKTDEEDTERDPALPGISTYSARSAGLMNDGC